MTFFRKQCFVILGGPALVGSFFLTPSYTMAAKLRVMQKTQTHVGKRNVHTRQIPRERKDMGNMAKDLGTFRAFSGKTLRLGKPFPHRIKSHRQNRDWYSSNKLKESAGLHASFLVSAGEGVNESEQAYVSSSISAAISDFLVNRNDPDLVVEVKRGKDSWMVYVGRVFDSKLPATSQRRRNVPLKRLEDALKERLSSLETFQKGDDPYLSTVKFGTNKDKAAEARKNGFKSAAEVFGSVEFGRDLELLTEQKNRIYDSTQDGVPSDSDYFIKEPELKWSTNGEATINFEIQSYSHANVDIRMDQKSGEFSKLGHAHQGRQFTDALKTPMTPIESKSGNSWVVFSATRARYVEPLIGSDTTYIDQKFHVFKTRTAADKFVETHRFVVSDYDYFEMRDSKYPF